jgi:hypothetical protein
MILNVWMKKADVGRISFTCFTGYCYLVTIHSTFRDFTDIRKQSFDMILLVEL